jgi:glycosyltransferase involved in cell wall biosynthesis
LEDNEKWISQNYLAVDDQELLAIDDSELYLKLPSVLSHPFDYQYFISLADSVILIQEKLSIEVPSYIPLNVIPWGVDLTQFHPEAEPSTKWGQQFLIKPDEKVIVYHGGLNGFTRSAMLDLCRAVVLINESGVKCKLIRSGVNPINFWDDLPPNARNYIFEAGVVEKQELPSILALADLYVQPGKINSFEDLRLPSKLPEFLSMGKPVIMPNVNIANLFKDGTDVILLKNGDPQEIANACLSIFESSSKSIMLGKNARIFAEKYFDLKTQASILETCYTETIANFNIDNTKVIWKCVRLGCLFDGAMKRIDLLAKDSANDYLSFVKQVSKWAREIHSRLFALNSQKEIDGIALNTAFLAPTNFSLKSLVHKLRSLIR